MRLTTQNGTPIHTGILAHTHGYVHMYVCVCTIFTARHMDEHWQTKTRRNAVTSARELMK